MEYVDDKVSLTREDYLQYAEGCDLVPSSIQLSGIESSLVNALSRERLLSMFLEQYKASYDYIHIDCMHLH